MPPGPGYGGGYPPGPGYPPQGVRYGAYSAAGVPMRLKQSPGKGLVIGLCGIAALLLSYFATPWVSVGGEDVTFTDIREAFHPDESSASTVDPNATVTVPEIGDVGSGDPLSPATTSIDPNAQLPTTTVPGQTPLNTVTPPLPPVVQAPTPAVSSHQENLEQYTDWGWRLVLLVSMTAVVFSAWLVPRDRIARFLTGTLTVPCLGWVNFFDKEGASAPRVLGTLAALYVVLGVAGNAYYLFWEQEAAPDPAYGALLGIAGAFAVLVSCIIGTMREWVPEYS